MNDKSDPNSEPGGARIGPCPRCGKRTRLDDANPWRPFCSQRCKLVDLDGWFDGRYRIAGEPGSAPSWAEDNPDDFG